MESGAMPKIRERFDLRTTERWQPPPFSPLNSRRSRGLARARRLADLQAASIWRDLRCELPQARGDALDVGAGAQPYRTLLPPKVRYRAIDIEQAEARFGYRLPDTEYFAGPQWPVAGASADLVLATETLEHVLDPATFLAEARRVLRPNGRLIITVPFSARWHYIPYDYWRFTPSSLVSLLQQAGFSEVAIYARGNELTVLCSKLIGLIVMSFLRSRSRPIARTAALLMLPLLPIAALLGLASLRFEGGEDCLGWTAIAE